MSSFPCRGVPTSAASHHAETCNVVIFGETGAGKSSLINLVVGTQTALTSGDAMGCTTKTNVYDVFIQNETLKVKLFDTVGLGEGPEGKVPDKDARRVLKKLLRDLMKQNNIHLLMYCVRGVRATKALCRNYDLIRSEVKERVPIVLVATSLEDKGPEMEEWWRDNERSISDFGMTFAGHACVTTVTVDKYAEDKLKRRHKQSYHAVCQLIEQYRLSERVQTPLSDVGRWLHNTIQQVSTLTPRKQHNDIGLVGDMAASADSLINRMVAEEVAPTAPDLRCCTLQYTASVDLYDEIYQAFETIRLKNLHLEIKEHSILPETGASNDDQKIIVTGEMAASVGSHVNLMAGDEVAHAAPDMQHRMLQCSGPVGSDDETFETIETIRLGDPHVGIKEYPITPDIDDGNDDIVLVGEAAASNGSHANFVVGGGVAPTAPDIGHRMLPCSDIVGSDDETSEGFKTIRLGDPYLRIREPILMSRNNDIILAGKTASSNDSLVNHMAGHAVARAAPDVRRPLLQWSDNIHLDDETFKAFLRLVDPHPRTRGYAAIVPKMGTRCTVTFNLFALIGRNKIPSTMFFHRLEDLRMGITMFRIPSTMYARNKHTVMVLFWQTGVSKSALVNILVGERVACPASDTRHRLLQCTETVDLDDEISVETIRFKNLHLGIIEYHSPPKMGASRNKRELVVLFWQTGAGKRSLANLMTGEVASTPDIRCCIQCSETIHLDDKTSKVFSRLEDPHLRTRVYQISPKISTRNKHKITALFRQTGTGKRSLVNPMMRGEVAPTGPDIRCRMLQCLKSVNLDDEISKAFLRLEDPHLRIKGYPIPFRMVARIKHVNIVSLRPSGPSESSFVDLMSAEEVIPTAPDRRRCMLQCSETVNLNNKTSETFLHPEDTRLRNTEYSIPPKLGARRSKHQSIVLFGDTGAGKSSLINLIAGKDVACTSPDMQRCTMHWQEYNIDFGDTSYTVFDTVGIEAPQSGIKEYLEFVDNAYRLIKRLDKQGGIDLLLFCVRAGRVTATLQNNYKLFHDFLGDKKIPIVLAITNLEREKRMEDWWERNEGAFDNYQIKVAGHACITAADRLDGRHKDLYEESRVTIRNLVEKFTANEQERAWLGGDNLFVSLMCKLKGLLEGSSRVRRKDLVTHLTKRCGISREVAKQLADMIKQDEAT